MKATNTSTKTKLIQKNPQEKKVVPARACTLLARPFLSSFSPSFLHVSRPYTQKQRIKVEHHPEKRGNQSKYKNITGNLRTDSLFPRGFTFPKYVGHIPVKKQCCSSGMCIPEPGFSHPGSRSLISDKTKTGEGKKNQWVYFFCSFSPLKIEKKIFE
jgi:hypothetical protein